MRECCPAAPTRLHRLFCLTHCSPPLSSYSVAPSTEECAHLLQSAGARAVPIVYDAPREEIAAIVDKVNGLLLPGGGAPITPGHRFYDTVAFLVNLTKAANDAGEYFPVRGPHFDEWHSKPMQSCSRQQQSLWEGLKLWQHPRFAG